MTQQSKRLAIEFGLALVVCGVIAAFDRVLIGLAGMVLCMFVFSARVLMAPRADDAAEEAAGDEFAGAVSKPEHNVTGLLPHRYNFGNPIYHPQDDPPDAQGR